MTTPNTPTLAAGADGELWPLACQLLISKDGQSRSIWPVHLPGWMALGWQLAQPETNSQESKRMHPQMDPEPQAADGAAAAQSMAAEESEDSRPRRGRKPKPPELAPQAPSPLVLEPSITDAAAAPVLPEDLLSDGF